MSDTAEEVKAILRRTLRELDEVIDNPSVSSVLGGLGSLLGLREDGPSASPKAPTPATSGSKKAAGKASTPRRATKRAAPTPKQTGKAVGAPIARAKPAAPGAPKGSRRDDLLALIRERPGVTLTEAAERFGLKDSTSLYSIARRLRQEGLVVKDGAAFRPAPKTGKAKRS